MGQMLSYIPRALQGSFLKCDDDIMIFPVSICPGLFWPAFTGEAQKVVICHESLQPVLWQRINGVVA